MSRVPGFLLALFIGFSALAQSADLVVTIEAPESVLPGQTLTWTGTVENRGPSPAQDVTVRLTSSIDSCFDPLAIGDLFPNEKRTYTCTKTVPATGHYVLITFFAANSASIPDSNQENNQARATTIVTTAPDLFIFTNSQPIAAPALPFTVDVIYGNRAQRAATDTVITITTPTRFLAVPEFCTAEGGTARCTIGTIAPPPVDFSGPGPSHFEVTIEAPDASAAIVPVELAIDAAELDVEPSDDRFTREARTYRTFTVTNTSDADSGSLRAAANAANAECHDEWPCMIAFRIPGLGRQTIAVASALPRLAVRTLTVDGTTQAAYFPDSSAAIDGSALVSESGLEFEQFCGGGVRGLTITGFPGAAINVANATTCYAFFSRTFERNVLEHNGRGIELAISAGINDNVIRNNERSGIYLNAIATVSANVLANNGASGIFVGPTAHGSDIAANTITGNAHMGIAIAGDAQNISARRNSISSNGLAGIDWGLDGAGSFEPIAIPYLDRVYVVNGKTIIEGNAYVGGSFAPTIEIFANSSVDDSGFGEGERFLGSVETQGDRYTLTVDEDLTGKWITATAMRRVYIGWLRRTPVASNGDTGWGFYTTTSEFSRAMKVP